jgi:hypothetical protein
LAKGQRGAMGSDGESDQEDARSDMENEEQSQISITPSAKSSQHGSRRNAGSERGNSGPSSRADIRARRSDRSQSASPLPLDSDRDETASEQASERSRGSRRSKGSFNSGGSRR